MSEWPPTYLGPDAGSTPKWEAEPAPYKLPISSNHAAQCHKSCTYV